MSADQPAELAGGGAQHPADQACSEADFARPHPARPHGVAVIGRGVLGSLAAALVEAAPEFALTGAFDSGDDWPTALASSRPCMAFEATVAGRGYEHALTCLTLGVRPIVGTSGLQPDEIARLDQRARELGLGGFVVPNFSLGAHLLEGLAVRLALQLMDLSPSAEIIETHRPEKRDAPSGTALHLARALAAAGLPDTPIESRRLPDHYAHHELRFHAPGESLSLRHDMSEPAAFSAGILAALRAAPRTLGIHVGLAAILERDGSTKH